MEYYVSIHMSIILVLFTVMVSIFVYGIHLFISGMWPHLHQRAGVFYVLIAILWLGTGWLLIN